jgi:chromosome partitioning protein
MAWRSLGIRVVVALAVCAVATDGQAAAQDAGRDRGVQPPTELLREYPFDQGRLRSREPSQPRRAQVPARDPTTDAGASRWLVVLMVMLGASALLALGVAGRRLARADAGRRGPRSSEPAVAVTQQAPPPDPRSLNRPGRDRRAGSYAVVNQKGGVGKTTVSLAVGVAAARRGTRVLIVDLDPQASATAVLAPDISDRPTVADALLGPDSYSLGATVLPTEWGLDLAPSGRALRSAETRRPGAELGLLADQLATVDGYDLLLIDCPPSLGVLTIEGLTAASRALIVTEPTYLALHAIDELMDTLRDVSAERNPSLALAGVVLNRVENTAEHKRSLSEIKQVFGSRVLEPQIPKRAVLQDAMRRHVPPQDLPSHYADEIADLFDALAEQLEAVPARPFVRGAG